MEILLIIPRYGITNKPNYNYTFPLGFAYISSILKKRGYNVDCLNLNHLEGSMEDLVNNKLNNKKYGVVCTGHMALGYPVIEKIINIIRKHKSNPRIILGGPIITSEPEVVFNSLNPDFGIIGEGEITILELLKCLEKKGDLKKVSGLCYHDEDDKLRFTKNRNHLKDLDSLPFPDFEGFGFSEMLDNMHTNTNYFNNAFDKPRVYPILCSRSCPFQCTFCYNPSGSVYRKRSIKSVMEELNLMVKRYRINTIIIYDDLFAVNKGELHEFCENIKKLSKEISWPLKWTCQLQVKTVDKDMLKEMKEAGCDVISYGFESFSEDVLKSMKKYITPEGIDNAFKATMDICMGIQANFIFGDIAETKKTAYETLDYWKENCKGQVNLFLVQPYPRSALYEHCVKKGLIKDKLNFIKNEMAYFDANMTDNMTDKEFNKLKKDLIRCPQRYAFFVSPISIKNTKENVYDIKVRCPFCEKEIGYGNCLIENKWSYNFPLICRTCKKRFYVRNFFNKVGYDLYPIIKPLYTSYLKVRKKKFLK